MKVDLRLVTDARALPQVLRWVLGRPYIFLIKPDQIRDFGRKLNRPNYFGGRGAQKNKNTYLSSKEPTQPWGGVTVAPARSLEIVSEMVISRLAKNTNNNRWDLSKNYQRRKKCSCFESSTRVCGTQVFTAIASAGCMPTTQNQPVLNI